VLLQLTTIYMINYCLCLIASLGILQQVIERNSYVCSTCCTVYEVITTRKAIANGTCVRFCNQPKAHFCLPWALSTPLGQSR